MRISDWSSDVCSSDLKLRHRSPVRAHVVTDQSPAANSLLCIAVGVHGDSRQTDCATGNDAGVVAHGVGGRHADPVAAHLARPARAVVARSEEHTSELQSLMRLSYAVFCLKKKKTKTKR